MNVDIEQIFPKLRISGYRIASPRTIEYNCIAWAAEETSKMVWWPDIQNLYFWPSYIPREETLEAFIMVFEQLGYSVCDDGEYEEGFEKIAIYANSNEKPTHAARQLSSDIWTSKLGRLEDIEHNIDALDGKNYGTVAIFMKRPLKTT